jgi:cytidyltransferase-like protein
MKTVIVSISFDDARSHHIRFLEEAAKLGELHVLLWTDEQVRAHTGADPRFPLAERRYFLENIRHVTAVSVLEGELDPDALPIIDGLAPDIRVIDEDSDTPGRKECCESAGIDYVVISNKNLDSFPRAELEPLPPTPGRKKVLVTGCYDWFHSGHVRFFEEVSELGDVYAVVGHDANIAMLKGPHLPMDKQDERRYIVASLRTVRQAFISTGHGYLDAAPEIERIKPDIYAVNDDGDKGGKGEFCMKNGIEYAILTRTPKEGLTKRSSTDLRGF